MELKEIIKPVKEELDVFDEHFRKAIRSNVAFVDLIARYIINQKGKRIRPALIFLAAKACGKINESTLRGAALVEILHTATLIHDDVVDEADSRRGFPSLNSIWKNKIAVLMGDYLLAKGLLLSLNNNDFQFLKITSEAVRRMSEAEILQIKKSRSLDIDEETYLKIISDKTASLFQTCCEIGASSVSADDNISKLMKKYGENLGMVFQIRDDLLDYSLERESITGKPSGLDIKEKKLTLPLIVALANAPNKRKKEIIEIIKGKASNHNYRRIVEFVYEFGGIDYTIQKAKYYSKLALDIIQTISASPAQKSLEQLVEFALSRNK